MRAKRFLVLHFAEGEPQWLRFEGGTSSPAEPPGQGAGLPVVVLIPDRYFFYHLPPGLNVKGERRQRAAVALRLGQVFPAPGNGQEWGTLPGGPAGMPGFHTHPDLAAFWEQHQAALSQAALVTTPFLLAWCWSQVKELEEWSLPGENGEGPQALFREGELHVGLDAADLAKSLAATGQSLPRELEWREVLAHSGEPGLAWSRLRMPLRGFASVRINLRPYVYAVVGLTLAALLLYAVQVRNLLVVSRAADAWDQALHDLYVKALGKEPGRDPFGRLIAKLEKMKGQQGGSTDLLEFLASLSANAPAALDVESLSLSTTTGSVSGKVDTYEALEAYLKTLPKDGPYSFTLEQATSITGGVSFTLKVLPSQPGGRP